MTNNSATQVTVKTTVNAPVEKVWKYWTEPEHITQWNQASDDWHSPHATNNLFAGGDFIVRMEARDGSFGFDFGGVYDEVSVHEKIAYTMGDGRRVSVDFQGKNNETEIIETFDAESQNPVEMQQQGWQAILDNFRKYCESH